VYHESYAEEYNLSLMALNESRLPVLFGILHACWQKMKEVRYDWRYKMGYGDKKSWWFGVELVGAQ